MKLKYWRELKLSKVIKLTPEYIAECRKDFEEALANFKAADGKINFTKSVAVVDSKATVLFTPGAWAKMVMLIQNFDKEVAWHGVAKRTEIAGEYIISDIMVYPQEVTGATVNTDQEKYQTWLMACEDEVFNNIRMQGHSHVNMSTSPSTVDLSHQEKILEQLEDDMFYIFMIWNKSFSRNIKIYDLAQNVLYEDKDVSVNIADEGFGLNEFIDEAKGLVKERVYSTTINGKTKPAPVTVTNYKPSQSWGVTTGKPDKPKTQITSGWSQDNFGNYSPLIDDYDRESDLLREYGWRE